jgi:hypothetical protein
MGAEIDGVKLRINPKGVSWSYTLKMAVIDTIGGKVTQMYGVSLGDLTITGEFGAGRRGTDSVSDDRNTASSVRIGGPAEQKLFFDRIVSIIDTQMVLSKPARPVRFFWPERGWDFHCYIKSISQPGAQEAISASNLDFNPGYQLVLQIQEDNGSLTKTIKSAAQAAFIGRLTAGLGWKQSAYNGPLGYDEMNIALGGESVLDAVFDQNLLPGMEASLLANPTSTTILEHALTNLPPATSSPNEGD